MAPPGLYLATLGGSLYYAIAGIIVLISAWLVLRESRSGVQLFWLVYLATIIWSVWEVGLDGWALMPRLVYLTVAALWLLMLPRDGGETPRFDARPVALLLPVLGLAAAAGLFSLNRFVPPPILRPRWRWQASGDGEWTHYGNSLGGTRYSDAVPGSRPPTRATWKSLDLSHRDDARA